MGKLFNPPAPPPAPEIIDPRIEEERLRQLAARLMGAGRASTILTGGQGVAAPVLGTAAQLGGPL